MKNTVTYSFLKLSLYVYVLFDLFYFILFNVGTRIQRNAISFLYMYCYWKLWKLKRGCSGSSTRVVLTGCCRWMQSVLGSRRSSQVLQERKARLRLSTRENQLHSCDSCFPLHPVKLTTVGLHNRGSCPAACLPVFPNLFILRTFDIYHLPDVH